jgi:hypothetical protein
MSSGTQQVVSKALVGVSRPNHGLTTRGHAEMIRDGCADFGFAIGRARRRRVEGQICRAAWRSA